MIAANNVHHHKTKMAKEFGVFEFWLVSFAREAEMQIMLVGRW